MTTSHASRQNAAQSLPATGTGGAKAAPVATTTVAMAPQSGGSLPATMIGAFSGQYAGAEQGVFSLIVGQDGRITGVGQSSGSASFTISGIASANGSVVMNGTGTAGAAQFSGIIDAKSGSVVGAWQWVNGRGQGTFTGRRQ